MTDMEKLKTFAFWHSHLLACVENYQAMHIDDPETFDMPEKITSKWALDLLDDHLNCTDEMWSAQETYEYDFGEIEESLFEESYETFVSSYPREEPITEASAQ